jgi:hypothetical protein
MNLFRADVIRRLGKAGGGVATMVPSGVKVTATPPFL